MCIHFMEEASPVFGGICLEFPERDIIWLIPNFVLKHLDLLLKTCLLIVVVVCICCVNRECSTMYYIVGVDLKHCFCMQCVTVSSCVP